MASALLSKELRERSPLSVRERVFAYSALIVLLILGAWVTVDRPYTPGSDFGYYLGLVGGCMMASLLLYPLRKNWRRLANFGSLRAWFLVHMVFGILGPILVLFHSTFHIGSFNGGAAFWTMVVVTISGMVGRFAYLQLYHALGERQAVLWETERFLKKRDDGSMHAFDLIPDVRGWLERYREHAFATRMFRWEAIGRRLPRGRRWVRLIEDVREATVKALGAESRRQDWTPEHLKAEIRAINRLIDDYVRAVDATAPLAFWARVLAWWQIAHVPLIYLLAAAAIAHVVSVHVY
jgi:hypothetical protein